MLKGFEVSFSGNTEKYDWKLGTTIQRSIDNNTKERLIRRPNNKFTLEVGAKLTPKTRVGLDAVFSSDRIDNDFSSFPSSKTSLDSYSLFNLSMNHKLSKSVSIGARIENLGDVVYETAHGFNTPRRGAFFTFSYRD